MLYLKDVQKEASDLHLLKLWILDQTLIHIMDTLYLPQYGWRTRPCFYNTSDK